MKEKTTSFCSFLFASQDEEEKYASMPLNIEQDIHDYFRENEKVNFNNYGIVC